MKFLDREQELKRLEAILKSDSPVFVVLYGRRRCGKSALLQKALTGKSIYYMADQSDAGLQRTLLAKEISALIKGFDKVNYPEWYSLLINLNNSASEKINLFIDELPYLVKSDPALPSVLQKFVDTQPNRKVNIVVCGSAQQMMQGMVLNSHEPLYGRADEIFKVNPLKAGWIQKALNITAEAAIEEYGVWGGVPRYWELRKRYATLESAIKELLLDKNGVLHEEPMRLFLDDMRSAVQPYSIMSLVGMGCHKLSEIASRLEKPAPQLSNPISTLIDLGYLKREIPFNENERTSKKSVYKIKDFFMNFYFNFVIPNKSLLELDMVQPVYKEIQKKFNLYNAHIWEALVREAIPHCYAFNEEWGEARRWWGKGLDGKEMEIDVVAESIDKTSLLIAEVKWSDKVNYAQEMNILNYKSDNLPFKNKHKIYHALWVRKYSERNTRNSVFLPKDVLKALKR